MTDDSLIFYYYLLLSTCKLIIPIKYNWVLIFYFIVVESLINVILSILTTLYIITALLK